MDTFKKDAFCVASITASDVAVEMILKFKNIQLLLDNVTTKTKDNLICSIKEKLVALTKHTLIHYGISSWIKNWEDRFRLNSSLAFKWSHLVNWLRLSLTWFTHSY